MQQGPSGSVSWGEGQGLLHGSPWYFQHLPTDLPTSKMMFFLTLSHPFWGRFDVFWVGLASFGSGQPPIFDHLAGSLSSLWYINMPEPFKDPIWLICGSRETSPLLTSPTRKLCQPANDTRVGRDTGSNRFFRSVQDGMDQLRQGELKTAFEQFKYAEVEMLGHWQDEWPRLLCRRSWLCRTNNRSIMINDKLMIALMAKNPSGSLLANDI